MKFLEKDLEEIIYTADKVALYDKGLCVPKKLFRQLRIGHYGTADLVGIERSYDENYFDHEVHVPILIITVYELKKEIIGIDAFLQAIGYIKGIESYLKNRKFNFDVVFKVVLIGSKIEKDTSFSYITDLLPRGINCEQFLSLYKYNYDFDGIEFVEKYGYKLIHEGF